jgi:hypothetical protein
MVEWAEWALDELERGHRELAARPVG